jgi:hypothetical protein
MANAHGGAKDADPDDVATQLAEDVVEVLLKIGVLKYEHDIDIEAAFERRMETVRAFSKLQSELDDAETKAEHREIMQSYLEELDEEQIESLPMPNPGGMVDSDPIEAGTNVDAEAYDQTDEERDRDVM